MGCYVFLLSKRGELLLLHLIEHHHLSRTGQLLEYICWTEVSRLLLYLRELGLTGHREKTLPLAVTLS